MSLAQFILDCFPDAVSEYGLLGCLDFSAAILLVILLAILTARRLGF